MKKAIKELKQKSDKELLKEQSNLRDEITKLELEKKINPQKDTNIVTKKRIRLAQVLTILNTINNQ